jgi:hypothetical protein
VAAHDLHPAGAHALAPGYEWADYRVLRLLASGCDGLTYLAEDKILGTTVVIRELLPIRIATRSTSGAVVPLFSRDAGILAEAVRRLTEESREIAAVRHPNMARVLRLFLANGTVCTVSEYETGASLTAWRAQLVKLDQRALLAVLLPLLDALAAMHSAALVHGGICPSRIRMRSDGSPVLFPPSASLPGTQETNAELRLSVIPGYTAMENYCLNGQLTAASDLYALAAVAYTLITGARPVDAPLRLQGDRQPRLVDCAASSAFSTEFLRLIDQALSLGPASRPPGAAAFAHSLTQAAAAVDDAIVAEPPPLPAAFALEPSAQSAIQSALAECIGPIASVVLKKALASAENWPALTSALAENLPDAAVQKLFLQQIAHLAPPTQGAQPSVPAAVASPANVAASTAAHDNFDPEMLVQLEAELANQIGAIARIVLKRCVARASNRQALFKMLADEMGDPALGKKFLDWANARFSV